MQNMKRLVVLNFGGQYAHLIAKRFRHLGYYTELESPTIETEKIKDALGIILSGGPQSVYDTTIDFNKEIMELDIPILGLCYGHQLLTQYYGGRVEKAKKAEFGNAQFRILPITSPLFIGINTTRSYQVWMSHNDEVATVPKGFTALGATDNCRLAAIQSLPKKRFALQFHPEVKDTPIGDTIFSNFAKYCGMEENWSTTSILKNILTSVQKKALDKSVVLLLSGGVDSTVCFSLLNKALGSERVLGVHIDNGFMRDHESEKVINSYKKMGFNNFIARDESEIFLNVIKDLIDPQEKRLAVGETFIKVAEDVFRDNNIDSDKYLLCQGTLYPDIIESGAIKNSSVIKTHHNRTPAVLKLQKRGLIIEPLSDLYKDEVREIGEILGLPHEAVARHPFPGPGLSINVLCSDGIVDEKFNDAKISLKDFSNKYPTIKLTDPNNSEKEKDLLMEALPVKSVGVQGDGRTYKFSASFSIGEAAVEFEKLCNLATKLTNELPLFNRVVVQLWKRDDAKLNLQRARCTKDRLDMTRAVDKIVLDLLHKKNLYDKIFQTLAVCLPFASSAERASFVLRPVVSSDVMTATPARFSQQILDELKSEIARLPFIDALYYDITSKPPATFCWE